MENPADRITVMASPEIHCYNCFHHEVCGLKHTEVRCGGNFHHYISWENVISALTSSPKTENRSGGEIEK